MRMTAAFIVICRTFFFSICFNHAGMRTDNTGFQGGSVRRSKLHSGVNDSITDHFMICWVKDQAQPGAS